MKKSNLYLSTALLGAFALSGCDMGKKADGDAAHADMEKCYGIAKAGKNDCQSTGDPTSCQGTSTIDADPKAWMYLPKGKCESVVGGSLTPKG